TRRHSSDADYLADLAALADSDAAAEQTRQQEYTEQQQQQPVAAAQAAPADQTAYGYAQQQPDPYGGYPQQP
ncbi:cell division initiation protein, partial [Streptomyces sp. TRM76130]|nr:cell division initiation protein [Streptomyces sp. TRM76130]